MATTLLPAPPSGAGSNWASAWKAYQADPVAGYAAYYNFLKSGTTGSQLLLGSGTNYPAPGSPDAPSTSNPGGNVTPLQTGAVPIPAPQAINVGGQANPISRFGPGGISAYNVGTSYAGPESPAGAPASVPPPGGGLLGPPASAPPPPAPVGPPAATGAPAPAPAPPPTPVPSIPGAPGGGVPTPGGGVGGLLGGFGGNGGRNQAAAAPGVGAGLRGGLLGGGGNGASGAAPSGAPPADGRWSGPGFGSQSGAIDLPNWADNAWSAASMIPGWAGTGIGLAHAAARGYQTANTSALNEKLGGGGLDFGQALGGVLGFNRYGDLSDPQIMNKETATKLNPNSVAGVSTGGVYEPGWLSRLFGGTLQTENTPEEFSDKLAMANMGQFNAPAGGAAALPAVGGPAMSSAPPKKTGPTFNGQAITSYGYGGSMTLADGRTVDSSGRTISGGGDNGQSNPFGADRGYQAGNNSNDRSSANTNAAGQASNATGSYGQRGIGAGTYAKGGYVNDAHAPLTDQERDLAFSAMSQRFGPQRAALIMNQIAPAAAGPSARPDQVGAVPQGAARPPDIVQNEGRFNPGREADMFAEMDRDTGPMRKPPQPGMGIEGGWPIGLLSNRKPGKGKPAKAAPSESDLLNMAELARHQPVNMTAGGRVAGKPDSVVDNHPIFADEREFVVKKSAAAAAGPKLLGLLNTPRGAKKLRGLLAAA